ncbi:YheT family hydrolase [Andreprevotia chitinilytica]|uniref:YheT family hydrolase n=1 Tax=Andreprevotia chitinilytica TaxID=396808 RepID=UPI001FE23E19|nr:alpha/beta fold hydrolase [Andreprevotia chitinilytica]
MQTLFPALFLWQRQMRYRRESWVTPDLDSIVVDWVDGRVGTPIVVLFHGLEGGSKSHYSLSISQHFYPRGWRSAIPHFRGCGSVSNRLPRAYHAGDSAEIDWILRRIRDFNPDSPLFAVGVSLGGNALAKWLGEQGEKAAEVVSGAAVICAPLNLAECGRALDVGVNRHIYTREFLRTLKRKTLLKLKVTGNPFIDPARVKRVRTLREFDDLVTAPLHGFKSVDHYWDTAGAFPVLKHIAVPTLIINARNDPFIPEASLPKREDVSDWVTLIQPKEGGHVGFVTGLPPGKLGWLPDVLSRFFLHYAPGPR